MLDAWKLLFDANNRAALIAAVAERALPIALGSGIIIAGIAFVLSGSKAGQAVSNVATTVVTKGKI